jgi:DNA invertase Pin-like site-specific DNA recombinase
LKIAAVGKRIRTDCPDRGRLDRGRVSLTKNKAADAGSRRGARHLGVEFISLREQIDTGSPLGQAVFVIIGAIAELERSLITERVKAGLRRARAEGKRLGRPRLSVDERALARVAAQKLSVPEAAKVLGISPSSYLRLVRAQGLPPAVRGEVRTDGESAALPTPWH